jgi:hypothetical protein
MWGEMWGEDAVCGERMMWGEDVVWGEDAVRGERMMLGEEDVVWGCSVGRIGEN